MPFFGLTKIFSKTPILPAAAPHSDPCPDGVGVMARSVACSAFRELPPCIWRASKFTGASAMLRACPSPSTFCVRPFPAADQTPRCRYEEVCRKRFMTEIRDPSREDLTEASSDVSFGGGSEENTGRHAQVLLIEDDCAIREMIENYLTQHGMRVVSAADRNSATRHLSDEPSVIILDLQLGKDDGLDLLRAIRSRSDVPIIITTGHRRDEVDRVVGLELGADDYLTKPFGLRELLARIRAVLRRR